MGTVLAEDDETVCSFCGMSHLMYSETRKLEKESDRRQHRVEQLETEQPKGNLTFRLESGEMIVLPIAKWRETEEEIFATHCIAHRASADLRAVTASA